MIEYYAARQSVGGGWVTIWWGAGQWWNFARLITRDEAQRLIDQEAPR